MLTILALLYSEFPVILLYYAPISMHYSQNYSQDHCQNNPEALKMMLLQSMTILIIIQPTSLIIF